MDRPPPYFPQNSLSPKDDNKYRKFKMIIAGIGLAVLIAVIALGIGVYYFVTWMMG